MNRKILLQIIIKELKEIFRDKMCLVLFLIPLLIFPVLNYGITFLSDDTDKKNEEILIAVTDETNDEMVYSFLAEYENIKVLESDEPYELLNNNEIDFIIEYNGGKVKFVYNSMTYSSLLQATKYGEKYDAFIKEIYDREDSDISFAVLTDENGNEVSAANSILSVLSPIVFIIIIFQGSTVFANDMFAGEKERKTIEILMLSAPNSTTVYLGKILSLSIIEVINTLFVALSYFISNLIFDNSLERAFAGISSIICLVLPIVSLTLISIFLSAAVSIFSPTLKSAQIANELISAIPLGCAFLIVFGTNFFQSNFIAFIPFIDSIKCFIYASAGKESMSESIISFIVNIIFSVLLFIVSKNYMKSEKLYNI